MVKVANPVAAMLSAGMMLDWIGIHPSASQANNDVLDDGIDQR